MKDLIEEFVRLAYLTVSEGTIETEEDITNWIKYIVSSTSMDSEFRNEILNYESVKN